MKSSKKNSNWRGAAAATLAGSAVILFAAQLLAKPEAPRTTRITTVRRGAAPAAPTAAPVRSPLAGNPPLRELFRPLVSETPRSAARPMGAATTTVKAPQLPSTAGPVAAKPETPVASAPPAAPEAPVIPSARDLQMLGVVELDGQPQVLLKKTATGESRYFGKGENAYGFTVDEIRENSVALLLNGKSEKVAMRTDVTIEGPGAATVASASGIAGAGSSSMERTRDRSSRRERRSGGGDSEAGGESSGGRGIRLSEIFRLQTAEERLKKLEEMKPQLTAERYERLKEMIQRRFSNRSGRGSTGSSE